MNTKETGDWAGPSTHLARWPSVRRSALGGKVLGEEDALKAVFGATFDHSIADVCIEGEVLNHCRIGVELHRAGAVLQREGLGMVQEDTPDPLALRLRINGHVLDEQMIWLAEQDDEASQLPAIHGNECMPPTNLPRVVVIHRCWTPTDALDVYGISALGEIADGRNLSRTSGPNRYRGHWAKGYPPSGEGGDPLSPLLGTGERSASPHTHTFHAGCGRGR